MPQPWEECREGLVADLKLETLTSDQRLAYLKTTNSSNYERRKDQLSVIIPDIGSLGWDSAKTKISNYAGFEQMQSSDQVYWSLLTLTVPKETRDGFYDCLVNSQAPFFISVGEETKEYADFRVFYRPFGGHPSTVIKAWTVNGYVPEESPGEFIVDGTQIVSAAGPTRTVRVFREGTKTISVYLELSTNESAVADSQWKEPVVVVNPVNIDVSTLLGNSTGQSSPYPPYSLGNAAVARDGIRIVGTVTNMINHNRMLTVPFPAGKMLSSVGLSFGGASVKSNAGFGNSGMFCLYVLEAAPPSSALIGWSSPNFPAAPLWSSGWLMAQGGHYLGDLPADEVRVPFPAPRNDVTIVMRFHNPWQGAQLTITINSLFIRE